MLVTTVQYGMMVILCDILTLVLLLIDSSTGTIISVYMEMVRF